MSFHEDLNQKLNVFFNRDWFVELSEQEEEKMEELMHRQQEIDAALGLNQDNAGAMDAEEAVAMAA